jgi:hypothetical protein
VQSIHIQADTPKIHVNLNPGESPHSAIFRKVQWFDHRRQEGPEHELVSQDMSQTGKLDFKLPVNKRVKGAGCVRITLLMRDDQAVYFEGVGVNFSE